MLSIKTLNFLQIDTLYDSRHICLGICTAIFRDICISIKFIHNSSVIIGITVFYQSAINVVYSICSISYHNNDEIQPTPRICKVFYKSQCKPLHTHLEEKGNGEYSVHVIKDILQNRSVGKMDILQGL